MTVDRNTEKSNPVTESLNDPDRANELNHVTKTSKITSEAQDSFSETESYTDNNHTNELDKVAKTLNHKASLLINASRKRGRGTKKSSRVTPPKKRTKAVRKIKTPAENSSVPNEAPADSSPEPPANCSTKSPPLPESRVPSKSEPSTGEILGVIVSMCEEMKSMREDFQKSMTSLKNAISEKNNTIEQLKSTISERDEVIEALESRIDRIERDELADRVIISSPFFKSKSLRENLNYISYLTRTPAEDFEQRSTWTKFGTNDDQVMVRVDYTDVKDKLFREIRGKRTSNVYITELLTPKNNEIYHEARKIKKDHKTIQNVYTYKGLVHVRTSPDATPKIVRKVSQLSEFIPSRPHQPLNLNPLAPSFERSIPIPKFDPSRPPPNFGLRMNSHARN